MGEFDWDEAEDDGGERAIVLQGLLATGRDPFESLYLSDRLFDPGTSFVEHF